MIPSRRWWFVVPFALVLCAAVTIFRKGEGEDLLIRRRYAEAATALAAALPTTPAGEQDRVLLLLAEAQWLAGDRDAALSTCQRFLAEQSGSGLVPHARYLLAKVHEGKGDLKAAAGIYRDETERRIGALRKEEVAKVYLELATRAEQKDQPDHARAAALCDLALDLGLRPERARSIRLRAAKAEAAAGNWNGAVARLAPLVAECVDPAEQRQAMLWLARGKRNLGDLDGARAGLRDLLAKGRESVEAGDAAYEIALTYGVPQPLPARLELAVQSLRDLQREHPQHEKARIATYLIARCQHHLGRGDEALKSLEAFLAEPTAALATEESASARALRGDVLAQQGKFDAAIAAWQEYLAQHPSHGEWERVQRAIVDAQWGLAMRAYAAGKTGFADARTRFEAFARAFPLDARTASVPLLFGRMAIEEGRFDEGAVELRRCVAKYPNREESSEAQFRLGEMLETKTFDFDGARKAYRAVTWGSFAATAQFRVQQLEQKRLEIRTPRVFRTDEKAAFTLVSRNVESVRVRVFRLAMEDYFRATHRADDVERLDIEVIAADKVFDSAVPDYVRFRETERSIDLGQSGPGAYVVKVDDKELEATTLVLVSDLALIAKSSRHEFLVLAQNTKENRVESGVKVLLDDGEKVVAEGVTDARGFYTFRGEELKNRNDLRVFAVAPSGSGASTLDLSGMGYTPGLREKGMLVTDRPLYQPGQSVHGKAFVREVDSGRYVLPKGKWRVRMLSPSGREMALREVTFTGFGTFGFDFELDADAELGDWRVVASRVEGQPLECETAFSVARYERPRLQLAFELAERVVFRGEPIRGKVVATWFHGQAAAARDVVVRLRQPDGAIVEQRGSTTQAGEFAVEFATGEFAEEALAVLEAELPTENVRATAMVPVATTELDVAVRTPRAVYLANEPFEVALTVTDRTGKALARDVELVLLAVEADARSGALTEVELERRPVRTGADGTQKSTFAVKKGGTVRVRAQCKDRFGALATGDLALSISGDDDQMKLRLLCDRETYQVGEKAVVRVVNRAGPRLALVAFQGDGILSCDTRLLPSGESTIELALQPEHAPNFALALAMVDDNRLHTAERPFLVQRDLRIAIEAPKVALPGGKADVVVRVTDPEGRPVRTELALSLVDEALLALHGDRSPAIGPFFYGQLRETAFRTQSSCTWAYTGRTQNVDAALRGEDQRRDALRVLDQLERAAEEPGVRGPATGGAVAFDSNQWNSALGAGGGSGGRYGRRQTAAKGKAGAEDFALLEEPGQGELARAFFAEGGEVRARTESFYKNVAGFDVFSIGGIGGIGGDGSISLPRVARQLELAFEAEAGPRRDFRETGAFVASLVTGDDGVGRIAIDLPDSATAWRLLAYGITKDAWVGEARTSMRTQKDVQVEFVGPAILVEGDTLLCAARVHNLAKERRKGRLVVVRTLGEQRFELARDLDLDAGEETTLELPLPDAPTGMHALTGTASLGDGADALAHEIAVKPFGLEVVAGRSGSTRDRASFDVSLPAGVAYQRLRMIVELGPDRGRDLVRAAIGSGYVTRNCVQTEATVLARSSRGLAALAALSYLERTSSVLAGDRERLLAVAEGALRSVLSLQQPDGGFPWVGKGAFDVRSTAQALRFLAACEKRGLAGANAALDRTAELLLQASRTAESPARADLFWALATAGRARFEAMNALHRARTSLTADASARLALAWQASSRPELAAEVLVALRAALPKEKLAAASSETLALAAIALLTLDPRDALGAACVERLANARLGAGWETTPATAAAVAAFAIVRGEGAGAPRATEITVTVNGKELATTPKSAQGLGTAVAVPVDWLRAGENAVQVAVAGGGEAFYSVTLTGFRTDFDGAHEPDRRLQVQRQWRASHRMHGGRPVPSGFSVVQGGGYEPFVNQVTQLGVGESFDVVTTFSEVSRIDERQRAPMVLEDPIPAGCSVAPGSVRGTFDHFEVQPDRVVCWFRDGAVSGMVQYQLQARFAGRYRALPATVWSSMDPALRAHGTVGTLAVHPAGQGERDAYRLTPDELFHLGKAEYDAAMAATGADRERALAAAQEHFAVLRRDWERDTWRLRDDVSLEVARRMLLLGIERNDQKQVVQFFEVLKDKQPDFVIPFDKILVVGRSYFDLGEYESALLVFRGTTEASFLKDAAVATALGELGEHKASTRFLEQLLAAYPDLPTMRTLRYSVAQQLAAMAAERDPTAPVDEQVGSVAELRRRAIAQMREFLVLYPEDPLAEEVSFAWATTLLEGRDLKGALAVAESALTIYPESSFVDELLYTVGYAHFALGAHDAAFAALQRVATESFRTAGGAMAPSENQWHAEFLQGQIWHARGEPEKALLAYDRVKDRFSDAVEASDYFRRKQLAVEEVATFATEAKAELTITQRNVKAAHVQVFKVDLVRLYLLEKSLAGIGAVQLHGIRPQLEFDVPLGEGRDYKDVVVKVPLELPAAGAYLCVVRGDDRIATGMVLKSDLRVEVQEQFDVGRVRVNVRRGEGFVSGAQVKIVGSGDQTFRSGESDLRGVYAGDGVIGRATVLAADGDHYAFFRGEGLHQARFLPPRIRDVPGEMELKQLEQMPQDETRKFDAFGNNLNFNASNRGNQVLWLQNEVMNKKQKGVEVYRTK